jgi:hypothetical protein
VRRFLCVLLFLLFVDEGTALYADHIFAPFHWVHQGLLDAWLKVRLVDILFAGALIAGVLRGGANKVEGVRPMRRALLVAAGVTFCWFTYGVVRGGDARAASWQVYLLLSSVLASFAFASHFRTTEHFLMLARTALAAGVYRAVMCVVFYFAFIRPGLLNPLPEYITTHEDTVLWTVGFAYALLSALLTPSRGSKVTAALVIPLFLAAIQFNNRRLAWISLGGSLLTLYVLMPYPAVKRRVRRALFVAVPVVAVYAAVGWGRTEPVFRPLRAFQSVSASEDNSTKARNVENLGLIATANQGWIMGTGWGHRYVEISDKYQIHFFELWPYVPHNSVLGLLAYTGYLGFFGYWMVFPVATLLHARTARLAAEPRDRLVGLLGVVQVVACADQWYGDMGAFSPVTTYMLAVCFAGAMRLPVTTATWPDARAPSRPKSSGSRVDVSPRGETVAART